MFLSLYKKELKSLLFAPASYIFLAVMYGLASWMFFTDFFVTNQAQIEPFFKTLVFLMTFFLPALTMGIVADEKRNGTWELLLTSGVSETSLILTKFLAAVSFVICSLVLAAPMLAINQILGGLEWGVVAATLLGFVLVSACYVAVGLFASSVSGSPIVGYVVGFGILIVNNFFSQDGFLSRLPSEVAKFVESLSLGTYANEFFSGMVTLNSVTVILAICVFFITLAVLQLKIRNA